jgi:hypothetical protein
MDHLGNIWDHFDHIVDLLLLAVPAAIWFWRWTRSLETTVGLTRQTTTKHLPFIYGRLGVHDDALHLPTPEHPPLGLVNGADSFVNGKG